MTIKDIARAANVSPATVSRIINHKDDNISQETRERVLRIIDEMGYVPYAKIRDRILSQTNNVGLAIPTLNSAFYVGFASEIQKLAREHNYTLSLALTGVSPEYEASTLNDFARNRADGIIVFSGSIENSPILRELYEQGMGVVALDHFPKPAAFPQLCRDSAGIARECTQLLLDNNYVRIGLVLRPDCAQPLYDAIVSGYTGALTAAGLPVQKDFIVFQDDSFVENFRSMTDAGLTGLVCQDTDTARIVYGAAATDGIQIPADLSVISMEDAPDAPTLSPPLTAASTDVGHMARLAFDCLLAQISRTPVPFSSEQMESPIQQRGSIRMRCDPKPQILVSGYINTDIILGTPELPQVGKTQVASHLADFVGGKGANQAYGISRLGGNVYLLGCLGSDRRGRFVHETLTRSGVKMDGVSFLPDQPTGTAYISLYPDGRSSVLINPGANTALDTAYVLRHKALLRNTAYCLVQTDIPIDTVLALRELCDEQRIPMVLSPAYVRELPAPLLRGLYMLIPSERDARILCPDITDPEAQAVHLLEQGIQNVIIMSGSSGCLWASRNGIRHYPAYDYPCMDGTGTNDVFIGCLVLLLSEGQPMDKAIAAASWAAAYSATRLGVQNGFPDRNLLNEVLSGRLELHFPAE